MRGAAGGRKDLRARAACVAGLRIGIYRKLPEMLVQLEAGKCGGAHEPARHRTRRPPDRRDASRPNSRPAPIRIAATSRSSKAATSFAPTAWCRLRAAKSAAGPRNRCSPKRGRWPIVGYTEIQLLGQNVNSYRDPDGKRSFAELLAAVGEVPGIRRVRFTTSHPRDFGRDIVEAIDAVPTLCDHVHLPVQSGSTRVLDAMQRLYTRDEYLERISWMKAAKREISITTDVIVGFPGRDRERISARR